MIAGKQIIRGEVKAAGFQTFTAYNPSGGVPLTKEFVEATGEEVADACEAAAEAFHAYSQTSGETRAVFLEKIADNISALGDELLETAHAETGLPLTRLQGERGRTVGQLRAFAALLKEGSWVKAIIDKADTERQPLPKPDVRQMQVPLGPVAVFGASNFPFAFSVAGGDSASALAAGCPVVFKAHPAHPATCELVAMTIVAAVKDCGLPPAVFNMVQGRSNEVGSLLVQHPAIKAVGFTGSFAGGKALYDLAVRRPEPIPVYAEMSSVNPVFFLPRILAEKGEALAKSFAASITLGVGQFCTNPGTFVYLASEEASAFIHATHEALATASLGPMLSENIEASYLAGTKKLAALSGTESNETVKAHLFQTTMADVQQRPEWMEEVFGPCSVGIAARSKEEVLQFANSLHGQLTATVHGTEEDLNEYKELILLLRQKAGRLIINGFPTGVEVTSAMVHGGPFPATTDSRTTSVGTTAIYRFTRPVCFQDFPDHLLPDALKNENPLSIWRTVNGNPTR